jgi:6-phospho-3-hexuloisomerase
MDAVKKVVDEVAGVLRSVDPSAPGEMSDALMSSGRVFLFGAGRSGFVMRALAMRLMHLGLSAYYIGDATTPSPGAGDMVVALSGTGQTPSTIHVLKRGREAGAETTCITASPGSPITEFASKAVIVPGATKARSEHEPGSEQPSGSLFEQAAFLFCEAVALEIYTRRGSDAVSNHTTLE